MDNTLYQYSLQLHNEETSLAQYKGKVLLIVNTASQCGFTPQYEGLQALYQKYREQGLEVLAFPCNQFAGQEPGNDQQIEQFCSLNYQVTFPVFSKIDVNGESAHPLYKHLKKAAPGILGTTAIKWNFTKFLVDKSGEKIKRFAPKTTPEQLEQHIQAWL